MAQLERTYNLSPEAEAEKIVADLEEYAQGVRVSRWNLLEVSGGSYRLVTGKTRTERGQAFREVQAMSRNAALRYVAKTVASLRRKSEVAIARRAALPPVEDDADPFELFEKADASLARSHAESAAWRQRENPHR